MATALPYQKQHFRANPKFPRGQSYDNGTNMDVTKTPKLTFNSSWAYVEIPNLFLPMLSTPIVALSGHPRPADKHTCSLA